MMDGRRELKLPVGVLLTGLLFPSIYFGLAWLYQQTFHSVFEGAIDWDSEEGQQLIRGTEYVTAAYWGFGALWLAAWRLWTRHPFYKSAYRNWLRSTPWQPGMPLPKGSPMPGLAEAVLITLAVMASAEERRSSSGARGVDKSTGCPALTVMTDSDVSEGVEEERKED